MNRFSKDIGFMDDILVINYGRFFSVSYLLYISFIVQKLFCYCVGTYFIAIAANYYLSLPFVILCLAFIALRGYYIKTARDVKRLEALGYYQYYMIVN